MRYERLENLLDLVALLQSSIVGVSLTDIEERFSVSRRTAERMRDAIARAFPQLEEAPTGDLTKRWRIRAPALASLALIGAEALAELELAASSLRRRGLQERAALLESMGQALRAAMQPAARSRLEPDTAALMEAEGMVARAGPREYLTPGLITTVREAIKSCRQVRIRYQAEHGREARVQRIAPYGLLYGDRSYLVARGPGGPAPHLYRLSRISAAEIIHAPFERPGDFSIDDFAAQSFGVYQESPSNIRLRFSASAADEARSFIFHSSQSLQSEPDGSLVISFRAGGLRELCWFLFSWGADVVIEAPARLHRMFDRMIGDLTTR